MGTSFTTENLEKFWGMAAEKGLFNKNTAQAIRGAAQKVLSVLEDHERMDLRSIDRDHVFTRFQNLHGMKYTPESLGTYKSRFNTALDEFFAYADDPSGYKAPNKNGKAKRSSDATRKSGSPNAKRRSSSEVARPAQTLDTSVPSPSGTPDSLTIPIPIRDGLLVRVFGIPTDLSADEASKISAVIQAYAIQK